MEAVDFGAWARDCSDYNLCSSRVDGYDDFHDIKIPVANLIGNEMIGLVRSMAHHPRLHQPQPSSKRDLRHVKIQSATIRPGPFILQQRIMISLHTPRNGTKIERRTFHVFIVIYTTQIVVRTVLDFLSCARRRYGAHHSPYRRSTENNHFYFSPPQIAWASVTGNINMLRYSSVTHGINAQRSPH